jgi:hypothetical protein
MTRSHTFTAITPGTGTLILDGEWWERCTLGTPFKYEDGRYEFHGQVTRRRRQRDGSVKVWLVGHEGPTTSNSATPIRSRVQP